VTASIKRIGGGKGGVAIGAAADYYDKSIQDERQQSFGIDGAEPTGAAAAPGPAKVVDEYLNRGAEGAAKPEWWSPASTIVQDGAEIRRGEIRKLLDGTGIDGAQLVQAAKINQRVGGWDITLSLPKSASALYATATPHVRSEMMADLVQSARATLQALHDRGVFETRRGKDGATREVSADVAVALVPHVTNRDGHPQMHVHAVLANVGRREDGTTGALDPAKLYPWKTYAGAMFRTEFADRLAQRGLAITEDGQSFAVAGVPERLTDHWSSRRATILAAMDKVQADLEFGASAAAAAATAQGARQGPLRETDLSEAVLRGKQRREMLEEITRSTRQPGRQISGADLEANWQRDLSSLGLSREGVWESARDGAARHQRPTQTAGEAALTEALDRSSVVTERTLRRLIAEHAQTRGGGAGGASETYDSLINSGTVLHLAKTRRGELVMSTRETLNRERQMLLDAMERRGEGSLIRSSAVEAAIAGRPTISDEQARAVRYAARGDGVVVIEGIAGSGKSFTLAAIAEAAKASGATPIGLAPSWDAADTLRRETALPGTRALQGFVQGLEKGGIAFGAPPGGKVQHGVRHLGDRVVLIVDEAGMAESRDGAVLLSRAREAGAQVILVGDRKQLESVGPGAAFAAIADQIGVTRLEDIRRQRHAPAWQQAATRIFAAGDSIEGLTRYDVGGRLRWAADADEAVKLTADEWDKNRQQHPEASRLVLATRNAEVHALNKELRDRMLAAGELGADAVTVRTLHAGGRNGSGEARETELRTNDRIIIGANLTKDRVSRDILPNDIASVIRMTPARDPMLTLRMDRTGKTEIVRLSDLGQTLAGDRKAMPKVQHAYAMTINKSQGKTTDYTILHSGTGLDASRAYVGLTRHRYDAVIIANAGGIGVSGDGKAAAEPWMIQKDGYGQLSDKHSASADKSYAKWAEEKPELARKYSIESYVSYVQEKWAEEKHPVDKSGPDEKVRQAFLRTAKSDLEGRNAADYVADKQEWLRTGDPTALPGAETRWQAAVRIGAESVGKLAERVRSLRPVSVPAYIREALSRRQSRAVPVQPNAPAPSQATRQQPGQAVPAAPLLSAAKAKQRQHQAPRTRTAISEIEAQQQLREALAAAGFDTARMKGMPLMDGARHYAPLKEDRGKQQRGAYRAHYHPDGGRPAGAIWNHHTGDVLTWKADGQQVAISPEESERIARRLAEQAAQRERDQQHRENQGAIAAHKLWDASKPADPAHQYLVAKGIGPEGLRQDASGRLVVPLSADGKLVNAQTITADGTKRPQFGARKIGAHFVYGALEDGKPIAIGEGLATAESFHVISRAPTVMAVDTCNLAPVAQAIRAAYPRSQIIFATDNDAHLPLREGVRKMENVGLEKARAAALMVGNAIVLTAPEIPQRTASDQGTDWNDVVQAKGLQAARATGRAMLEANAQARAGHAKEAPAPAQQQARGQSLSM
jgi:conjugative relaxase-like TrwC/TraI family protein